MPAALKSRRWLMRAPACNQRSKPTPANPAGAPRRATRNSIGRIGASRDPPSPGLPPASSSSSSRRREPNCAARQGGQRRRRNLLPSQENRAEAEAKARRAYLAATGVRPNPSLSRDPTRQAAWAARRLGLSYTAPPKRLAARVAVSSNVRPHKCIPVGNHSRCSFS
jgi:hypothetical protein